MRERGGKSGRATSPRLSTRRMATATRSTRGRICSSSIWRRARQSSSPTATSKIARGLGLRTDSRSRSRERAVARASTRGRTSGSLMSRPVPPCASPRTSDARRRPPGRRMGPPSRATAPTRRSRGWAIRWSACGPFRRTEERSGASPNATTAARCSSQRPRSRQARSGRLTTRASPSSRATTGICTWCARRSPTARRAALSAASARSPSRARSPDRASRSRRVTSRLRQTCMSRPGTAAVSDGSPGSTRRSSRSSLLFTANGARSAVRTAARWRAGCSCQASGAAPRRFWSISTADPRASPEIAFR